MPPSSDAPPRIGASACVEDGAVLGRGVEIGHATRIHANVEIGDGARIGDFCVLGHPAGGSQPPLVLGSGACVRSHAVLYEGSRIGPGLETGHHVVIRDGAEIGENLRIGSHSSIEGACRVGDYVRLHGYVHVGRGSRIGDFAWIFSLTTLMNDPLPPSNLFAPVDIGPLATICVGAQLLPGIRVGAGAFVAAGAIVRADVEAGRIAEAPDGGDAGPVRLLAHLPSGTRHPWPRHMGEGYPKAARDRLRRLCAEIHEEGKDGT